jgi:hypothetical protein
MDKVESSELCEAIFGRVTKIEFLKIANGPETIYLDDGSIITFPDKLSYQFGAFNSYQIYTPSEDIKLVANSSIPIWKVK